MTGGATRRGILRIGALAGGGMLLRLDLRGRAAAAAAPPPGLGAFIRVPPTGPIVLVMPQQEMGQGIHTAHAQLLAEELDIGMDQIAIEQAPPDDRLYGRPATGTQGTGGSTSIRSGFYMSLRQAGADARALLIAAAARRWQVPAGQLETERGTVFDRTSGRRAAYGDLADAAARLTPGPPAPLRAPADFRLIGKPVPRLDTPSKTNGSAVYGIDVMAGKVRVASVLRAPVVGGRAVRVDEAAVLARPGVERVIVEDDLVAVVAANTWAALSGGAALDIVWDAGPNAAIDTATLIEEACRATAAPGLVAKASGDVEAGLAAGRRLEAAYDLPMLAHAPMEPLNCTVQIADGVCTLWVGTQVQTRAQREVARLLGLPVDRVRLNNQLLGGAFGRRLDVDMILAAVRIARALGDGLPVKAMWSREEDMRQDTVRPLYRNLVSAAVRDGRVTGVLHRVSGPSIGQRISGRPPAGGIEAGAVEGATEPPYAFPAHRVEYARHEARAVHTGYWRGVGPNSTVFAIESMMDELALLDGRDPLAFRLAALADRPRLARVLRAAAERGGWGGPLPPRRGRGIALQHSFGSPVAAVCEVSVGEDGRVRIERFVAAVDCGRMVNPRGVVAQIEGGALFGLTAALWGEITIEKGRIRQSNFHDYRLMRIDEVPPIEVHLLTSTEAPGGVGEPGTTIAAPALTNAIAAATGVRLRRLPIDETLLRA